MNDVHSEEEEEVESPIKKGDFLTMSQLQRKVEQVIPDEETISYNTSGVQHSQLTYSMSQNDNRSIAVVGASAFMMKIEEVSESQHSVFSGLQNNDSIVEITENRVLEQNEKQEYEKQVIERLLRELDEKEQINQDQEKQLKEYEKQIHELGIIVQDQYKIINYQDNQIKQSQQNNDIKLKNQNQIIQDQTEQIKLLHRQLNFSGNSTVLQKIKSKQELLTQTSKELFRLFDQLEIQSSTPTKNRNVSRSQHNLYNTEPSKLQFPQ